MKKLFQSTLFLVAISCSSVAFAEASTNESNSAVINPIDNDQEVEGKNTKAKYSFTLFNFFATSSKSESDSTTTGVVEMKDPNTNSIPKTDL